MKSSSSGWGWRGLYAHSLGRHGRIGIHSCRSSWRLPICSAWLRIRCRSIESSRKRKTRASKCAPSTEDSSAEAQHTSSYPRGTGINRIKVISVIGGLREEITLLTVMARCEVP